MSLIRTNLPLRLWRARKNHVWIDAQLHEAADGSGVDLKCFYDGELLFASHQPTATAAQIEADKRLRDLQRAGWTRHW